MNGHPLARHKRMQEKRAMRQKLKAALEAKGTLEADEKDATVMRERATESPESSPRETLQSEDAYHGETRQSTMSTEATEAHDIENPSSPVKHRGNEDAVRPKEGYWLTVAIVSTLALLVLSSFAMTTCVLRSHRAVPIDGGTARVPRGPQETEPRSIESFSTASRVSVASSQEPVSSGTADPAENPPRSVESSDDRQGVSQPATATATTDSFGIPRDAKGSSRWYLRFLLVQDHCTLGEKLFEWDNLVSCCKKRVSRTTGKIRVMILFHLVRLALVDHGGNPELWGDRLRYVLFDLDNILDAEMFHEIITYKCNQKGFSGKQLGIMSSVLTKLRGNSSVQPSRLEAFRGKLTPVMECAINESIRMIVERKRRQN